MSSVYFKISIFVIVVLTALSSCASKDDTDYGIWVRYLNKYSVGGVVQEIRVIVPGTFDLETNTSESKIVKFDAKTDWYDIGNGAVSIFATYRTFTFDARANNSQDVWVTDIEKVISETSDVTLTWSSRTEAVINFND